MATCSVQTLMDEAACFSSLPEGTRQVLELRLLCLILQNLDPMATCDVQTLLNDAACLYGLPEGTKDVLRIQLLCEIYSQMTGGGAALGSVANYTDLRAYGVHNDNDVMVVLGYAAEGDGGGGTFWFDAASTVADDDGTVIRPNDIAAGDPGRWIRL